jgi:hypothetical protein
MDDSVLVKIFTSFETVLILFAIFMAITVLIFVQSSKNRQNWRSS